MLADVGSVIGDRLGRRRRAVAALQPIYAASLRALYGRRGMPWRVNGETMRIDPSVRHLVPRENERALFEYLRARIRPGALVFDVGAFVGTYALLEARWAGTRGRVVAFEPSPFSFSVLQRHVGMNGLSGRIDARRAAVGAACGRRNLMTFHDEPYRNQIAGVAPPPATTVSVEAVTIDAITAEIGRPPDWIRMDVQGLEFDALEGARETIRAAGSRLSIVVETHPEQWPDYGIAVSEARERFAAIGLNPRALTAAEPLFTQSGHAILEPMR